MHTLGFESSREWKEFSNSSERPDDIPKHPKSAYKNKGWISLRDWLGIKPRKKMAPSNKKVTLREFNAARSFVHTLGLKSWREWIEFANSSERPIDIPKYPQNRYKNKGWVSYGDWLGTVSRKKMRPYNEARLFVHALKLDGSKGWIQYRKSGKKPQDIPYNPERVYKEFVSYRDWTNCPKRVSPREFNAARAFVHTLGLKSWGEWKELANSSKRPIDIPKSPEARYKNKGWVSTRDWLGIPPNKPYDEARLFVHALELYGYKGWLEYLKSGKRPAYIPSDPRRAYKEFISWGDWLGRTRRAIPREFNLARSYVHTLGLQSWDEWKEFVNSKEKPNDIPKYPKYTYKNNGWISLKDWLGVTKLKRRKIKI